MNSITPSHMTKLIMGAIVLMLCSCISQKESHECKDFGKTLKDAYENAFYIGAAASPMTISTSGELLTTQFSGMTAENIMKPISLQPLEGVFSFRDSDRFMSYARENDMVVHGHVLVWHNQTGDWMFRDGAEKASPELLEKRMEDHINTVVGRYKGQIKYWDVVNEAISDGGSLYREDSLWFEIMGSSFIEKAFIAAHKADPEARLYYNDYNVVDPGKRDRIYTMVKDLVDRGVPIHGIGIQAHWSIYWPNVSEIEKTIDLFAGLGLEVQITELDMSVYEFNDKSYRYTEATNEILDAQAQRYWQLFDLFKQKSEVIKGVTFWGIADDHTWLDNFPVSSRKNWPFLFDANHQKKPAFNCVIEAAGEQSP